MFCSDNDRKGVLARRQRDFLGRTELPGRLDAFDIKLHRVAVDPVGARPQPLSPNCRPAASLVQWDPNPCFEVNRMIASAGSAPPETSTIPEAMAASTGCNVDFVSPATPNSVRK